MVEFVNYDGRYPCLCIGELVIRIDGKDVNLGNCLTSGGNVWFHDWEERIDKGEWIVSVPNEYQEYAEEITKVVNENVPYGCCGGCI